MSPFTVILLVAVVVIGLDDEFTFAYIMLVLAAINQATFSWVTAGDDD